MTKTSAKEFALSQVNSCTAVAYLTRPPASVAGRVSAGRFASHAEAVATTRTLSAAPPARC